MTEVFDGYYVPELHNLEPGEVHVKAPIVGTHIQIGLDKELVAPLLQPLVVTCSGLDETDSMPSRQVVTVTRPDGAEFNLNDVDGRRMTDNRPLLASHVMSLTVSSEGGEFWHLEGATANPGTVDCMIEVLSRVGEQARKATLARTPWAYTQGEAQIRLRR